MKIILDTDIGSDIDDALALLLLLQLEGVELLGIRIESSKSLNWFDQVISGAITRGA